MNIKKGTINHNLYNIISEEEYFKNPAVYCNDLYAIERDGIIYPVQTVKDRSVVGFYPSSDNKMAHYVKPSEEEKEIYDTRNIQVTDFSNLKDLKDVMEKSMEFNNMELHVLTDCDHITVPKTSKEDEPEMAAFKQAIIDKHFDVEKYKSRMDQYLNDIRLLDATSISFYKLKSLCKSFDIKITITFDNTSPDVANPLPHPIKKDL